MTDVLEAKLGRGLLGLMALPALLWLATKHTGAPYTERKAAHRGHLRTLRNRVTRRQYIQNHKRAWVRKQTGLIARQARAFTAKAATASRGTR